ncbi:putative YigZ family protein [Luteibacter rhizovicinus]|uniref:Putative YigZ family protein n=1 Tax=Luteibacter rhizovicinus TaxID=242606 RepID=A0A4R3Z111_9GAMM|nr:YigZ family protein [Luteibacter rhizovicinus]TCV97524.1 putative YigZ family protein [Luteibacter rhizovicinus]
MSEPLSTLAGPCRYEEDIRKSRFLAQAAPVDDPAEALAFVARAGDPSATHNCWAYRIGDAYRFNDDGEPGGTAGKPILQAIDGQARDRVVVVVTRWFGGIKLGAGGLIRAYGGCAAECLRRADRVALIVSGQLALHCEFAELAIVKARLRDMGADIEDESFDATGAALVVRAEAGRLDDIAQRLTDLSRGRIQPRRLD